MMSDDQLQRWLKNEVRDRDGNPTWYTAEVFDDAEIVKSTLNKFDNSHCEYEEWLEEPGEGSVEGETENSSIADSLHLDFQKAIDSVDYLINYWKTDLSEVCKLKSMRTKMIENE